MQINLICVDYWSFLNLYLQTLSVTRGIIFIVQEFTSRNIRMQRHSYVEVPLCNAVNKKFNRIPEYCMFVINFIQKNSTVNEMAVIDFSSPNSGTCGGVIKREQRKSFLHLIFCLLRVNVPQS